MKKNKFTAVFMSALMMTAASSACLSAAVHAAEEKHTVKFLDFDGKVMTTIAVASDEKIDYNSVDVSSLHKHIDKYTERDFASWNMTPETTDKDITIQALSKTAFVSIDGMPAVTKYFSRSGRVDLYGFKAAITITTQIPEKDANGNYKTESNTVDITSSCTATPSNLKEAFYTSDSAQIDIVPMGDDKPLYSYVIYCCDFLGDVDNNGTVDSIDASAVLTYYANNAASASFTENADFKKRADVNMDNNVDARDASLILKFYALASVEDNTEWSDILP